MRRALLALVVLLLAVPAAAAVAAHFYLDGDALRARLAEQVRRATGRELTIKGKLRLAWSLTPAIEADDVSLSNPPGMSRPEMAHADRVQAEVALLPLLSRRVELHRVVLVAPDVLLERDAAGHPNWVLAPPAPPSSPDPAPAAPSAGPRFQLVLGAVALENAHLAYRGAGAPVQAVLQQATYAPDTGAVSGALTLNGAPLTLTGTAGPITAASVPLDLKLAGRGVAATVAGTSAQAAITVEAADLAAVSALAGRSLPPVKDVRLSATLASSGLSDLKLATGPAELGGGARLIALSGASPSIDQPVTAQAEVALGQLPVALAVKAGSLAAMVGRGPILLQLLATAGDATLSGAGSVADLRGNGLDVAISARIPDLARLGTLAGLALPPARDVTLQTRLALAPPGLTLRGLRLSSAQGDVAGDLAAGLAPRPFVRGSLVSQRLDLDAWTAGPTPAAAPSPSPAAPPPAPSAPPAPKPDRVIPDTALPFAALSRANADLHLAVAEADWRGIPYRAIEARLLLQDGRLRLDPLTLQGPGGAMRAQVAADGVSLPPSLTVTANAPGLAAGPLLALLGAPEGTSGTIDLDAQLSGAGSTLRALAATLTGHLGAAMVEGEVDNRWLADLLAETLRAANLPLEPGGHSRVRCAALRADAASGEVRLQALALDTSKLELDGGGQLSLGNETLDLHVRPQLRAGARLELPIRIGGTFRSPRVALDPGVLGRGRVGLIIGGAAPADTCGPALALARDGHPGAAPAPPEAERRTKPADLLRGLLR